MISGLMRVVDNFFGRGDAAVTVPALDGPLRHNRKLDEAGLRLPLAEVDSLASVEGQLFASAGHSLYIWKETAGWQSHRTFSAPIAALAGSDVHGLIVALANGEVVLNSDGPDSRTLGPASEFNCIAAIAAHGDKLYLANGSATLSASDWQRDLLERNAAGSLWVIDLESGRRECLARNLAYPSGLLIEGSNLIYSEAWKHRIMRMPLSGGTAKTLYSDLAGYPGRLSTGADGYWLSVFAPRSQLVEFVLREPEYRKRMLATVPQSYWIAPKLRSGLSFYEPLQGGGVKHLGMLKPWAPTMSAGLCVKLDSAFQPIASLHSRADGHTHGVTATIEHQGRLFAAARGNGVVVGVTLSELGERA